jgi:hypothetical protein
MQEILHEVWAAAIMRPVKNPRAVGFRLREQLHLPTQKLKLGEQIMKSLKAICSAATLALVLSVPVYAGDVLTPGYTAPPPPPQLRVETEQTMATETSSTGVDQITPGLMDVFFLLLAIF